jgi:predicted nucleic acid-binding Zn ribbon protein
MKTCQWCDAAFNPKVKYQIYCSEQCRELATKEKIAQRYAIARRNRMINNPKSCKSCSKPLSAYNEGVLCASCIVNPSDVTKALKEIKGLANGKDKPK